MNKKIIPLLASILVFIIIVFGGFFYYQNSGKTNIQKDHEKYLTLINDNHDFDEGVKGLESLDNEKGQNVFKNIKTEIKIAKELKNADSSLDNKDIDSAKKSLEKVDTLTIDNSFDKAIDRLKEDITNYEKALKEIKDTKADDTSSILDKYKFKHNSLKIILTEGSSSKTDSSKTKVSEDTNKTTQKNTDQYKVDSYDSALAQNYNHYQDAIFDYIKKSSEAVSEATGVHADRVSYGGIDSRGIIVKIFDNQKGEVGHYIFTYNINTNMCTLDSVQAGPVVTYKAIYHV